MDRYIGDIELFSFNYAPRGWLSCEGQLLTVAQNQALFALLGNRYGGDGKINFALPDLRTASPNLSMKYYIAIQGLWPPMP